MYINFLDHIYNITILTRGRNVYMTYIVRTWSCISSKIQMYACMGTTTTTNAVILPLLVVNLIFIYNNRKKFFIYIEKTYLKENDKNKRKKIYLLGKCTNKNFIIFCFWTFTRAKHMCKTIRTIRN